MTHCADIAVVSQGGSPHDATLHASISGLVAGYLATVHGGVVVLIAECSQGAGPTGFLDGVSDYETEEDLRVAAEGQYVHGMDVARLFLRIISSRKVVLCSRLRESLVAERLSCTAVRDPTEGLESAQTMVTSKSRIAILPDGNSTMPVVPK
jgi:nickel-dependent lactate racemase